MGKFQEMLEKQLQTSKSDIRKNVWYNYASTTNSRGELVVEKLGVFGRLRGKRLLDIGSGYGGVVVSAAKRKMESVGIDSSLHLIELSQANAFDNKVENRVSFQNMDVLDYEESFSKLGKFDFIVCDNVIEHVLQPEKLVASISLALENKGIGYITIPNAFSVNQVMEDCHYGQKFLSLLSPLEGLRFVKELAGRESYDVGYYYPLSFYKSLFQKYNLEPDFINPFQSEYERIVGTSDHKKQNLVKVLRKSLSVIKSTYNDFLQDNKISQELLQILETRYNYYIDGFEMDINFIERENITEYNLMEIFSHYYVELFFAIVKK